jgi:probable rRNA maturation factor
VRASGVRSPRAARPRIDVARDGTRSGLSAAVAARAALAVLRAERARLAALSITFVSDAGMKRLNRRHLSRSGLTDVIAFALRDGEAMAGDIYIAPGAARVSAAVHRVSLREELVRLVIHGTLHVLGWDHPEGDRRVRSAMWKRQEALVRKFARNDA